MRKQKDAVVEEIANILGSKFDKFKTNVLLVLTPAELETVKKNIGEGILAGTIDYSKDKSNLAEVRSYARSMVMNHIKKAKELNGNIVPAPSSEQPQSTSNVRAKPLKMVKAPPVAPRGVDVAILPQYMKDLVRTLV
jgi:hypothetical protein